MKKNLNRTLILTAAVLTLGAAAYAQSVSSAAIDFPFHANGTSQASGAYSVIASPNGLVALREKATGHTVQLGVGIREGSPNYKQERPRLVFSCTEDGGCNLSQVWIGDGRGFSYSQPKQKSSRLASIRVVYFGTAGNK